MKSPYTSRQGQFLAFIHQYIALHGRAPTEAEMGQFFQVTPPSVHQMILTLERRGLITRAPGRARSIQLKLSPEELSVLPGVDAATRIQTPALHTEHQQDGDQGKTLLRLGKIQIDDLFAHNARNPFANSEFIPLLDTLIESFARAGLGAAQVKELRRQVCELFHHCCQEAEPESTFKENLEHMFSYLPGTARTNWHRWI